jgi:tRNA G46 methylase TrmB
VFANSRPIRSSQSAPHPRLAEIVLRHLREPWRRTPSAAGRAAFDRVAARLRAPFVLDAGCGTGLASLALARRFPQCLVLGVDKSAARLARAERAYAAAGAPANLLLLQSDLVDFWQLAAAAGLRCVRQYLLYPNPWPKPAQLRRRWHAHPVLPAILQLGGKLELRANWRVYAEEFAAALGLAGWQANLVAFAPREPLTPFEAKYQASGHCLWRCLASPLHQGTT